MSSSSNFDLPNLYNAASSEVVSFAPEKSDRKGREAYPEDDVVEFSCKTSSNESAFIKRSLRSLILPYKSLHREDRSSLLMTIWIARPNFLLAAPARRPFV